MGSDTDDSLTEPEGTTTKIFEGLMLVFGIVVGSGFDTHLEVEGKCPEQWIVGALLYWMGISVVARLTLGGILHLHIEYGATPPGTDLSKRRSELFRDIAFYVAYALILRYAAALCTSVAFFAGQLILFAIALGWSWFANRRNQKQQNEQKRPNKWRFWIAVDAANLVVAAIALYLLQVARFVEDANRELWVLGVASVLYLAIGVGELRCLLTAAYPDKSKP